MRALTRRLAIFLTALLLAMPNVSAAQPEDKGKEKDKEPPGQARQEPAQQPDRAEQAEARAEARVEQAQARVEQAAERAEARTEQAAARTEQTAQRLEVRTQQAEAKAEQAASRAERVERATEARLERQQAQEVRKTHDTSEREEKATDDQQSDRAEHRHDLAERAKDHARVQVANLTESLRKLEHARWSFNPHDTRGQGNMGKVDMQDPFGFDKDSGREGQNRGRPCRGNACTEKAPPVEEPPIVEEPPAEEPAAEDSPVVENPVAEEPLNIEPVVEEPPAIEEPLLTEELALNLEQLVSVDFQIVGEWAARVQSAIDWYSQNNVDGQYDSTIQSMQDYLARITESGTTDGDVEIATGINNDTINYTLNLGTQEQLEGTTLLVTTSLISVNDYAYTNGTFDAVTGTYTFTNVQYDAGEVVVQQTETVTVGTDSTYVYSYDPDDSLVGYLEDGNDFQFVVTVTDPASGSNYTTTYDQLIYLYRCPYGIIYDKTIGKAIAGATVTVHHEDGSVALLDKAANPNVSNPQTTDATGRYNCKLAIGKKYYLSVNAPGYQDYKSSLFSERWHIVREDVGMSPLKLVETSAAAPTSVAPAQDGKQVGMQSQVLIAR